MPRDVFDGDMDGNHEDPWQVGMSQEQHDFCVFVAKQKSARELTDLAKEGSHFVRKAVAENRYTPPTVLDSLSNDHAITVRAAVAGNPRTPSKTLALMANSHEAIIEIAIARNPNSSGRTLNQLSRSLTPDVVLSVAQNSKTPPTVLDRLSTDVDRDVVRSVALNKSTPVKVLERLAHDEDPIVRNYVARNESATPKMLLDLVSDKDPHVREEAQKHAKFLKLTGRRGTQESSNAQRDGLPSLEIHGQNPSNDRREGTRNRPTLKGIKKRIEDEKASRRAEKDEGPDRHNLGHLIPKHPMDFDVDPEERKIRTKFGGHPSLDMLSTGTVEGRTALNPRMIHEFGKNLPPEEAGRLRRLMRQSENVRDLCRTIEHEKLVRGGVIVGGTILAGIVIKWIHDTWENQHHEPPRPPHFQR